MNKSKWPESLTLIRHAPSAYNVMKGERDQTPLYREFLKESNRNDRPEILRGLARQVEDKFALKVSDFDTPLHPKGASIAKEMARKLKDRIEIPDVIFVSPYLRTLETFEAMMKGWPALRRVKMYEEERIREQEHGLANLYNDWRVFHALHPEQAALYRLEGSYWYQYPQGENVPMVRERNRSWITTLIREFSEKRVLAVTHHLTILSVRAQLERFGSKEFKRLDRDEKPINCGATIYETIYESNPKQGRVGKLVLKDYNLKLHKDS